MCVAEWWKRNAPLSCLPLLQTQVTSAPRALPLHPLEKICISSSYGEGGAVGDGRGTAPHRPTLNGFSGKTNTKAYWGRNLTEGRSKPRLRTLCEARCYQNRSAPKEPWGAKAVSLLHGLSRHAPRLRKAIQLPKLVCFFCNFSFK